MTDTYTYAQATSLQTRHRSSRSIHSLAPSGIHSPVSDYMFNGRSTGPGSTRSFPFTADQFKVLHEMQRVMYRGVETGHEGKTASREEMDDFIENNFDEECLYESPLLTLQNTQLLQHAATLSHSVSSAELPSLKPRALVSHATSLARYGWRTVFGSPASSSSASTSTSSAGDHQDKQSKPKTQHEQRHHGGRTASSHPFAMSTSYDGAPSDTIGSSHQLSSRRGHTALASAFARYYTEPNQPHSRLNEVTSSHTRSKGKGKQVADGDEHWWKAWDVRSVCGEVNEMETYDGFHFGFVEHTLILSFLPDWLDPVEQDHHPATTNTTAHASPYIPFSGLPINPRAMTLPNTPGAYHPGSSSIATRYHDTTPSPSLTSTIKHAVLHNVLRYKLHLHTLVEFNEAGKIVYIRDLVDLRDLWEGLVPFGRETAWIGRRLGGVALAGLGRLFWGKPTTPKKTKNSEEAESDDEEGFETDSSADEMELRGLGMTTSNSLGLNVDRVETAPDVDSGGEGLGAA